MQGPNVKQKNSTPAGFVKEDCSAQFSEDAKTFLIRVPRGFDITHLDGRKFSSSSVKEVYREDGPGDISTVYSLTPFKSEDIDIQPLIQCQGKVKLGPRVKGMLSVSRTCDRTSLLSQPPVLPDEVRRQGRVAMPGGLRPRFTPFGAGNPTPAASTSAEILTKLPKVKVTGDRNNNKKSQMFTSDEASDFLSPTKPKKHKNTHIGQPVQWQPLTPCGESNVTLTDSPMTLTDPPVTSSRKRGYEEGEEEKDSSEFVSPKKKMKKHKHKADIDIKPDPDETVEMDSTIDSSINTTHDGSSKKKRKRKKKKKSSVCDDSSDIIGHSNGATNGVDRILWQDGMEHLGLERDGDFVALLEPKKEKMNDSSLNVDDSLSPPNLESSRSSKKKKKKDKK